MSRNALFALLLLAAPAVAQDAADGPGPNLVITVAGQAAGEIVIDLLPDVAPQHVAQITALAGEGAYDGVVFHRVIDGFMAQTGDVQFGKAGGDVAMAGMGGSDKPDLPAEFSDIPFDRGVVGMARAQDPDSANSQFFIMFAPGDFLNGQYTVVGRVISGMDIVDAIKRGDGPNGEVTEPDRMDSVIVQ
jgi:peptidylprolyl isomerase